MALIKDRHQPCRDGCGMTRGQFIESLINGPTKVDIDVAARIWGDQQKALHESDR
jgi:hypothetical protein